jgi:putative sigma-54 modulation protein
MMRFTIHAQGIDLTEELKGLVHNRLHFALARLEPHVGPVHVYLRDENGPRGGIAELCRLRTQIGGKELIVERTHADIRNAISAASDRLGDAARRTLARQTERR